MLLDVLHEDIGNLLAERDGELGERWVLEEGRVCHDVLHGILGHGRLQTPKVALEDHGVLVVRADRTRNLGHRA